MNEQPELVTVFRSPDGSAEEDSERIRALLAEAGLTPVVLDDKVPGVIEGTWEVRVPAAESARAEQLIAADSQGADNAPAADTSDSLDLETVFQATATVTAEMEATEIQTMLRAQGIDAVVVGASTWPNFPFEVRVPRSEAARAREAIAEAQESGTEAAEEAEAAGEAGQPL